MTDLRGYLGGCSGATWACRKPYRMIYGFRGLAGLRLVQGQNPNPETL